MTEFDKQSPAMATMLGVETAEEVWSWLQMPHEDSLDVYQAIRVMAAGSYAHILNPVPRSFPTHAEEEEEDEERSLELAAQTTSVHWLSMELTRRVLAFAYCLNARQFSLVCHSWKNALGNTRQHFARYAQTVTHKEVIQVMPMLCMF